jgi:hypothetical protein
VPTVARDPLAAALCAAELGEPYHPVSLELLPDLLASLPKLQRTVPFAALRLLGRFARDRHAEVRAAVARALPLFSSRYPEQAEALLLRLASDEQHEVRAAAAAALATLWDEGIEPA